jgi:hypothetical protein
MRRKLRMLPTRPRTMRMGGIGTVMTKIDRSTPCFRGLSMSLFSVELVGAVMVIKLEDPDSFSAMKCIA